MPRKQKQRHQHPKMIEKPKQPKLPKNRIKIGQAIFKKITFDKEMLQKFEYVFEDEDQLRFIEFGDNQVYCPCCYNDQDIKIDRYRIEDFMEVLEQMVTSFHTYFSMTKYFTELNVIPLFVRWNFPNLKKISLINNGIVTIQFLAFLNVQQIEEIDLRYNQITIGKPLWKTNWKNLKSINFNSSCSFHLDQRDKYRYEKIDNTQIYSEKPYYLLKRSNIDQLRSEDFISTYY